MDRENDHSRPHLSIVIPVFEEEDNLEPLVEEIQHALDPGGHSYEVILVDDSSRDRSLEVASALLEADSRLRLVRHRRNLGQSAALISGFDRARGAVVVTLDADLQNDPADIPRLLEELHDCDVVCGIRANRHDSAMRRISSRVANSVRNWVTRDSIVDVGCSLRVCRAEFLEHLPAFTGMHRFLPTLLRLDGARVRQVEVNHRPRRHGESKYGVGNRLWRGIADLFGVRWIQRRWIDRSVAEDVDR